MIQHKKLLHKTDISYPNIFAPMFRHNNAILNSQETHFETKTVYSMEQTKKLLFPHSAASSATEFCSSMLTDK